jgi:hypothetical protein
MRVAEIELRKQFEEMGIFPMYISFVSSSLIHTRDPDQFRNWMLSKICYKLIREFKKAGIIKPSSNAMSLLAGGTIAEEAEDPTPMENLSKSYEESWKDPGAIINAELIPDVDDFKSAIEDICEGKGIRRVCFLFDEAAHIFRPEQQRQFFTLFRDLRSPFISCNAAVYPGLTSYGRTFDFSHDGTLHRLERDVLTADYLDNMREIVYKQTDENFERTIERNKENFNILAYAVSGNPRLLLKTVAACPRMNKNEVNEIIKRFYRTSIWTEHSCLGDRFGGHKPLIDWGRNFIEDLVLPETKVKNDRRRAENIEESTCFFWIHRNAPEKVIAALNLLAYTGIVSEMGRGIRATRAEIGTRYGVNLGCLFALEPVPTETAFDIAKNLSVKKLTELGANHPAYNSLTASLPAFEESDISDILIHELSKPIDNLDITSYQKSKLKDIDINTIGDVLRVSETEIRRSIYYVGEIRARRIMNSATAAVLEFLSG